MHTQAGAAHYGREWLYIWYSPRQRLDLTLQEFAFDHHHKLYHSGQFFDLQSDPDEKAALFGSLCSDQSTARAKLQAVLD